MVYHCPYVEELRNSYALKFYAMDSIAWIMAMDEFAVQHNIGIDVMEGAAILV